MVADEHLADVVHGVHVVRAQRYKLCLHRGESLWHSTEGPLLGGEHLLGKWVAIIGRVHDAIDHQQLVVDTELRQLTSRAGCLLESCLLGTADENQSGLVAVGEVVHRLTVDLLARLQSRELSKTRNSVLARFNERCPGRWQLEHAQRVASGSRVEDDVVVPARVGLVGEEVGELVEGGYLNRAGTRQLFLHVGDG